MDDSFTYSTSPGPLPRALTCRPLPFDPAANRSGYCQYYASAMVMMARSGRPAGPGDGFAPGERQEGMRRSVSRVERPCSGRDLLPGYGWQIFEATKSIESRFARLTGDSTVLPPPPLQGIDPLLDGEVLRERGLNPSVVPLASPDPVEGAVDPRNPSAAADDSNSRTGNALIVVVLVAGALLVVWVRMRQMHARWRLLPAGDRAWRQLTAAAGRAGVGPRPSETIYEYLIASRTSFRSTASRSEPSPTARCGRPTRAGG